MGKDQQRKLGRRVNQLRASRAWSQAELAHRAGVADKTISNIENAANVKPATILKVMRAFGDEGVEALREVGYEDWADTLAEELEAGLDDKIAQLIREYIRSNPEDVRRLLDDDGR